MGRTFSIAPEAMYAFISSSFKNQSEHNVLSVFLKGGKV
jgi:hypothetical protein